MVELPSQGGGLQPAVVDFRIRGAPRIDEARVGLLDSVQVWRSGHTVGVDQRRDHARTDSHPLKLHIRDARFHGIHVRPRGDQPPVVLIHMRPHQLRAAYRVVHLLHLVKVGTRIIGEDAEGEVVRNGVWREALRAHLTEDIKHLRTRGLRPALVALQERILLHIRQPLLRLSAVHAEERLEGRARHATRRNLHILVQKALGLRNVGGAQRLPPHLDRGSIGHVVRGQARRVQRVQHRLRQARLHVIHPGHHLEHGIEGDDVRLDLGPFDVLEQLHGFPQLVRGESVEDDIVRRDPRI
eukprot:scaffold1875_cov253-Pinguiococcus_pyrenoidosus.AAC.13